MPPPVLGSDHPNAAHDPAFQAKIALEVYSDRDRIPAVAREHGLSEALVHAWCLTLERAAVQGFTTSHNSSGLCGLTVEPTTSRDIRMDALELVDVHIAILEGPELRYRFANLAYRNTAGQSDLLGRRLREVFPVSTTDGVEAGILTVLQTGQPWEVNNFAAHLPGQDETLWEGKISSLPVVDGELPAVVVWVRDVTASKRVELDLRHQIALMQAISENSPDVMFAKGVDGRMQYANPAALALLGSPLHEVIGRTDAELLADQDAARLVMENDRRILESGEAEEVEEAVPTPDGSHRVWLSQKRAFRDGQGKIIGLLGVSRDITQRKNAELSVRAAHDALQRVLDSISDGLAVLDHDWNYTYFSETGAKMLGLHRDDLIGENFWELFPQADELLFGREYRRAMETGLVTQFEDYYPEPLNKWIECSCYPSPDGLSIYFRDVTDRRVAQEAAAEGERRIKALLEATPVGLAYADAAGRILVINGEGKRIWGNPPEANSTAEYVQWKGWWADESERHGQPIDHSDWPTARALRGEHVLDTILEVEPFDSPGSRRLVLHRSVPAKNDAGRIIGAVTAMTDLTEAVQAKRAVIEGNHRITQLANTIPQLAWMADRDGSVHWFNNRWFDYTGRESDDMTGWAWGAVHDPDVLPTVVEKWKASLVHGTAFEMTFPLLGKDGLFRPFYTLAEPLKDLDGHVVQWFGTCTDVSALQRTQEDLTKTQQWLQQGLVTGKMVAWELDAACREIRYSDNAESVLGFTPGRADDALRTIHDDDRVEYQKALDKALANLGSIDELTRRTRPDNGKIIWIRVKGNAIAGENGQASGIRGILIDVTEQVLRERALADANDRKDEFLAMLAHELRNPLAPIATAAQLLTLAGLDAQRVKTSTEIIARQVTHMTRLIDDLLDVSRVTRGLVELDVETVQIKEVVNNAIEQALPLIESRHHELALRLGAEPAVVMGDRVRLCQVVVNLLNNAAKYTPQGGKIVLDIAVDESTVRIAVEDNGIGIDELLLPRVFDLFTQATRTPDRAQGGLGLGLALVDSLVRMHGGLVQASSPGVGRGSRFVVTLPIALDASHSGRGKGKLNGMHERIDAQQLSVMVVDDNADAADMLADILRLQGHVVTVQYAPREALATASENPCELYVLDIGLPDIDGYELVRRLREMKSNRDAVFVALTGYGQAHDKVLAKSAGFDHHLVKPVDISQVESIIRSMAN